tara:strand:+ start:867 stop:1421 length:555 start_codon:yes stop_codon:yes gene_type:complete
MIGLRTLVLNANYMPVGLFPLHTIPVEDAMTRIFNQSCHVVYDYSRKIQHPTLNMYWPAIIARSKNNTIRMGVKFKRETVYYRDHGMCQYCEKPLDLKSSTYDHVVPRSLGGTHNWENVVIACRTCNGKKGNRLPKGEFRPKRQPYKPNYWQLLEARKRFPIYVDHHSWSDFLSDWDAEILIRG